MKDRVKDAQRAVAAAGGLWTRPRLAELLGVSREAIADRERRGTLPPPGFTAGKSGTGDVRLWLGAQLPGIVPQDNDQEEAT